MNNPNAETIFHEARQMPPTERAGYLKGACGDDLALRTKVEGLLKAEAEAGSFMKTLDPVSSEPTAAIQSGPREESGQMIGRYKLLQKIGEGGFGTVWMAEQREPVKRRVAVKIIKLGMDTKQVIARFEAERQALAMMDHPNIATVLDAGATETGRPYFVMELVKGVPITDYCDQNNLSVRDRLDLFKLVCAAVQHAHQKGIVHRDIKPNNVMVTLHDGVPVPKVIDFGIAKATNQELTNKTLFTEHHQMIGTPAYMSPEQAEMSGLDIDTRSDIYSLGVLLYELLTGSTPFDAGELLRKGYAEMVRVIREEEPHKPSTRLSTLGATATRTAEQRRVDVKKLGSILRGDLDWIIMKALEKDRTRRYETATAFADDIRRHLLGDVVIAAPPSKVYRLRKLVRRNKGLVMASSLVAAVLLVGIVGTTWGLIREQAAKQAESQQRQIAEQKTVEAQDNLTLAREQEQKANAARIDAETQRQLAEEATQDARRQTYVANIFAAQANIQAGEPKAARARLDQAPPELRNWEWKNLHAQLDQSLAVLRGHEKGVYSVAFSPDGSRIASGSLDNTVRLWDTDSGEELHVLRDHESTVRSVAFSPDGSRIASGSEGGTVRVWDAETGEKIAVLSGHESSIASVAFSPDGSRIATGSYDDTVRLWDASTGDELHVLRGHESVVKSVAFSPDGSRIMSRSDDNTVRVWDADTGKQLHVLRGHESVVKSVAFSPDGSRIVSRSDDNTMRLWDADTGKQLHVLRGHDSRVQSVAFSPDGSRIASASSDKTIRVWDAETGEELVVLRGHEGEVISVAFSPDGSQIVSGSSDKTVRLWDVPVSGDFAILSGHENGVISVAFSPDGSRIASGSYDWTVRLWDATSRQELAVLRGHQVWVNSVTFSPDGSRIVTTSADRTVRTWDTATGEQLVVFRGHKSGVRSASFSPDGSRIASGSSDNTVRVWDAASGKEIRILRGHQDQVESVAFSPDGSRIVSGSDDKTIRLWDADTGQQLLVLHGHEEALISVAFSPDGSRIVSGSDDKTVRLWDTDTGKEIRVLRGHENAVDSVAFSPDGSRIASGSYDNTVRVWDASTGDELRALRGHEGYVSSVAFSPDGSRIASASNDKTVRLWDSVSYRDRFAERDEARRAEQTMTTYVDDLFSEGLDCSAVAEKVRADETLSDPLRHAAINLVLKRCSAINEQAATLIDDLKKRLIFVADIREAIQSDPSLEPRVRAAAINIARWIEDSPRRLSRTASQIVDDDERSPDDYERAQRAAAAAFESDPASLYFTRNLAKAWDRLQQPGKAMEIWREHVDQLRAANPVDDQRLAKTASTMLEYGMALMEIDHAEDAEPVLRACLSIREEVLEAGDWRIANARSNLGESLAKQAKFTEAEPLLIEVADALQANEEASESRKNKAIHRVVDLYEAWHTTEPGKGYDTKAAQWRTKLSNSHPTE